MKIALMTLGTRGDVQPYAVLGKALQQRGHQVTLSTAKNFEALVQSYGIDFLPVDVDFEAVLQSEEGKRMMKNPFSARKHLSNWVYPMMINSLTVFYGLAQQNDKVLYHIKTMADYFADQFPHKMIRANVVPAFEPTSEFINPVFSALPPLPFINRFSYILTQLGLKMWRKPVRIFRQSVGLPLKSKQVHLPSIYGISEYFLKKPTDYPADSRFTGFWTAASTASLPKDIVDFIAGGAPPLLITFGSMPFNSQLSLPTVLKTISKKLNIRIIVVQGWGLHNTTELLDEPTIKVVPSVPYDLVLPLCKAAVHHGGIGTTAACLQAGKPFFACPVLYPMGDQLFWGNIAFKKGVALRPVPLKKLTEAALLQNIDNLLNNDSLYKKSFAIMQQLQQEDGTQNAIAFIEKDTR